MDAAAAAALADRLTETAAAARLPASLTEGDPWRPRPFRIDRWRRDLSDTFTVDLVPLDGPPLTFAPGQFNMLYVHGAGEVPISISGDPDQPERLVHTTRAVGQVTNAMKALRVGDTLGVRGPFGTPWPVEAAFGHDVVIVAGGIGLAPLRPLIHAVLARRERFGTVVLLYGARTPEDILYRAAVTAWRGRFDMSVHVTVDRATGRWSGPIGMVTKLIARGGFDARDTMAYVCGPEVMMRHAAQALIDKGVAAERLFLSMERNMKCAIGLCGHCQWGADFVCKDGPVFRYDRVAARLAQAEV
ncbi:Ni/Fe hydrogenase subunit gamma [Roseospira marina]|uniref:Ni/Fe hydrogenase subunit gamma n=1 Tax=Roseospira marina TaxID=140057 RepID=A0A5M6IBD1_9PROT|nr:FAD/NAD(P)-binding protein [Roseospira marina]KAA5605551.1 Ni/Fe hydrogenase subunit gamma [Roseospira marina]MBB4313388.1 NAD(P)H-flavin reductase [Roseospira marina]MBB5085871.1 NAD(P)H-flavin reductase [Roseospira marina]